MTGVRAAAASSAAVLLVGCAVDGGRGWELDGEPVSDQQLVMNAGPEHCGWESVTFLWVAWPPGTRTGSGDSARQYVRDPDGLIRRVGLDLDARLPGDATATGFRNGDGMELWFAESDGGEHAYLVEPSGEVEAWPRADPFIGCD